MNPIERPENNRSRGIIGGILNLLWYGLADLFRGRILLAIVKAVFGYFSVFFTLFVFFTLRDWLPPAIADSSLPDILAIIPYAIIVFADGYRTFTEKERETPVRR